MEGHLTITLLGLPWDASSSHARGAALAPAIIRSVLFSDASSPYSLSGADFREAITGHDFADLPSAPEECRQTISTRIASVLSVGNKPLSLGGDHSVTYPILRAIRDHYGPVNVLHIDAHPDLYDEFEGDKYSHACPFARALEDNCVNNLIQLGIRSASPDQRAFGEKHGVTMRGADEIAAIPYDKLAAPLYVSIDLDGLDPAYAPGVSHPEPGGLSTREVLTILSKLPAKPIGADIVELNPERDINMATALVATRLVKEFAAIMV
jgi:agmatinase